jgi:cytochrome c biogenesis protein ResB
MRSLTKVFLAILAIPGAVLAQGTPNDNPISAYQKQMYGYIKGILLSSADAR